MSGSGSKEKDGADGRLSYSSATESDDFSLWSDTGDLAEQFANEEDPLRIELDPLNNEGRRLNGHSRGGGRKKVAFKEQDRFEGQRSPAGLSKEAIPIPEPPPRHIPSFEKLLALIMAPNDPQGARARGLVGKPLLCVLLPTHVSLAHRVTGTLQACSFHWVSFCLDMIRVSCPEL